ncbi:allantoate amidohydrolase [Salinarimonas ramus]|uniref:Zn-dependent hydrolase n=1 Tax=Salinarimonas ramus TaxID=690164 RepID=A0A917V5X4_9HYPH|nr:allantoate amidohydrolase [Salinarimonas ramus]GGK41372.1 Zn-dependent hydrolase [Salinarimonas ramus]
MAAAAPGDEIGARAMAMIADLARHTDEPGRLTRLYLSPAHRACADATAALMRDAGLAVSEDALGTIVGRREGPTPDAPTLMIGSHIDSVVNAGIYDGPLGVVCGILAADLLRNESLPFALEILAFGDEENVRFPTSLASSSALAGHFKPEWLEGRDAGGTSLREALLAFGGDPEGIAAIARDPARTLGYLEVHIEQGPVLEARDLAVGVVTAINGATRARCTVEGMAGHAGTVPMGMRQDALAATAEMIALVERAGTAARDAVATVGVCEVEPGALNVIPARTRFTLDIRAPDDAVRAALVEEIVSGCRAIAERRGVTFAEERFMDQAATAMDERLAAALETGAARAGEATIRLPSGAGHDAVATARLCPSAMLFVRCAGGISHNPAESIDAADAGAAVRTLVEAVRVLGQGAGG